MGLFDFFSSGRKRSNLTVVPDHIWLNESAKLSGIRNDVLAQQKSSVMGILLVAHFADVFEQLSQIAAENSHIPIRACLAKDLSAEMAAGWAMNDSVTLAIIAGERHPLPKHDQLLTQFAESLPVQARLITHVSLEDPFMKRFAGEWLENVLKGLGMTENEAIESPMVSRRINAAQLKIEQEAIGDSHAHSAAEWLAANLPGTGHG